MLQDLSSLLPPVHGLPRPLAGRAITRDRFWVPRPPQVALHGLHDLYAPQMQSTENILVFDFNVMLQVTIY